MDEVSRKKMAKTSLRFALFCLVCLLLFMGATMLGDPRVSAFTAKVAEFSHELGMSVTSLWTPVQQAAPVSDTPTPPERPTTPRVQTPVVPVGQPSSSGPTTIIERIVERTAQPITVVSSGLTEAQANALISTQLASFVVTHPTYDTSALQHSFQLISAPQQIASFSGATITNSSFSGVVNATTGDFSQGLSLAPSTYTNWGSTHGADGYGIRDNAGTLQYKNSGGTWVDLSSGGGGSLAIGSPVTSATEGSLFFAGASGNLSQDNSNFFYDATDHRLGLGTTTPGQTLTVDGTFGILEGGSTPTYHTIFQGGDQSVDLTYTLPTAQAGGSGYVLSNNGSGILSWVAPNGGGGGMSIGSTITSGTPGSVLYTDSSNQLAQDNANFFYDATAHRLGLGTNAPTATLAVAGTANVTGTVTAGGLMPQAGGRIYRWAGFNIDYDSGCRGEYRRGNRF